MGLSPSADLLGFAIFQIMQTRLGTAGGAATQIVVMITSLAYMPGFGIASAGTTLVGQSIGAGARDGRSASATASSCWRRATWAASAC